MTVLILIQFIAVESIKCVFFKQCYFNLSESLSYPSTISFSWVGLISLKEVLAVRLTNNYTVFELITN